MTTPTRKSQDSRPPYCRNCYEPMEATIGKTGWRCEKCGLEHRKVKEGEWKTVEKKK